MLILNVDDDSDDREMFHEAVEMIDPNISCLQFESCKQAIDFLSKSDVLPDLMFIDINMPKMNGYECVSEIYKLPGKENISIVMFSTAFNPALKSTSTNPELRYLKKTSLLSELADSIKNIMSQIFTESEGR